MSKHVSVGEVSDGSVVLARLESLSSGHHSVESAELHSPWSSNQSGLVLRWQRSGVPKAFVPTRLIAAQMVIKRLMDLGAASMALVVLAPFLLLTALAIKLTSPGPIFFRQQREGLNGELFRVYKFRTMKVEESDDSGIAQTTAGDPRITRIGRFLRKTSIDELPQLLNVVLGQMSLVGPRPHVPGMLASGTSYERLVPYYRYRLQMLPGITGWAQANGYRGPTTDSSSARARVDHDIAYIQNYSLLLDIKILLKTIRSEFVTGSGH